MPERVITLSRRVSRIVDQKLNDIRKLTASRRILALNAMIEAARAGDSGRGFSIVAEEVKAVSTGIQSVADELNNEVAKGLSDLRNLGGSLVAEVRGRRLADLSLNMIDTIDRSLYERSADIRWWATDSAVVSALSEGTPEYHKIASDRLGVILKAYTVYLDLWISGSPT